jgi:hypothetical protein
VQLHVADPPERWEALGFTVVESRIDLGGVAIHLGGHGSGITSWGIRGIEPTGAIDGLATAVVAGVPEARGAAHLNGAVGLDHVVVLTPDFERTSRALADAGIPLRRIRELGGAADAGGTADAPPLRQGFRRLGPAILELVEARGDDVRGPARFWGLVVIVEDLDALAARLGDRVGQVRHAVQPARRIATLRGSAGLSSAVAFMDPEPPPGAA